MPVRQAVRPLLLLVFGVSAMLAACSKPPPPPPPPPPPVPPTVVSLEISATPDANADAEGQGDPVAVRVYQLTARSAFDGAEFFPLYHGDTATLGTDLVRKDEFLLIPGTSKSLTLMPDPAVRDIGIFAAYADFQHATWRVIADIPAHQTTTIKVTAERAGLTLTAKSETPPAAKPPSESSPPAKSPSESGSP